MWSVNDITTNFDAEAGDVSTIATTNMKILWFNQGQARLLTYNVLAVTLSWVAEGTQITLPSDFVQARKIEYRPSNSPYDRYEVRGQQYLELVTRLNDFTLGAAADGDLKLTYDAEWPEVSEDADSILSRAEDTACLYYSLHRFWRLIASNRGYYKRYATLVGANAVSVGDIQAEADRYLADFTDARDDIVRGAPAFMYPSD
jgi:hypothetical protein